MSYSFYGLVLYGKIKNIQAKRAVMPLSERRKNMKKLKKYIVLVTGLALLMTMLAGCGGSAYKASKSDANYYAAQESSYAEYSPSRSSYEDYGYVSDEYETAQSEEFRSYENKSDGLASDPNQNTGNAKLIYRANMGLQTTTFDETVARVQKMVEEYGGYIEYSDLYGSTYRTRNFTVRIPSEKYAAFVNAAEGIGNLTNFSESVENITNQYYDTELRLQSAKNRLEQLEELMKQAENMDDMITIQNAITDAQYEIDYYSGTLRQYDNLVGFSTVSIYIQEVSEVVDPDPTPIGFGQRLAQAFKRGVSNTKYFFQDLLLGFADHFVGWIVFIAIVVVLVFVIRKAVKRGKEKDRQRQAAIEQQRQMMQMGAPVYPPMQDASVQPAPSQEAPVQK